MHPDPNHPRGQAGDKEGYTSPDKAMRGSLKPFALAIIIALVAALAAMVLWLSWDGPPRDPGQMSASEAGPSRVPPDSVAEERSDGAR